MHVYAHSLTETNRYIIATCTCIHTYTCIIIYLYVCTLNAYNTSLLHLVSTSLGLGAQFLVLICHSWSRRSQRLQVNACSRHTFVTWSQYVLIPPPFAACGGGGVDSLYSANSFFALDISCFWSCWYTCFSLFHSNLHVEGEGMLQSTSP